MFSIRNIPAKSGLLAVFLVASSLLSCDCEREPTQPGDCSNGKCTVTVTARRNPGCNTITNSGTYALQNISYEILKVTAPGGHAQKERVAVHEASWPYASDLHTFVVPCGEFYAVKVVAVMKDPYCDSPVGNDGMAIYTGEIDVTPEGGDCSFIDQVCLDRTICVR